MKVTLVHGKYFNSWEALGLGYIGAYLKQEIPGIEVNFFQGCFDDDEKIIDGAKDADFVAFSCTTPTFPYTVRLARCLKEINPGIQTVVGGYHASSVPDACLVDGMDYVITGEGEGALADLVRGGGGNGLRLAGELSRRIINGRTMEFTELPWPDRELIQNERNIQVAYRDNKKRITSFQSHRACPFMCKYCLDGFNKVLYGNVRKAPMRYRPVQELMDEIDHVVSDLQLDLIKFSDPTWNTNVDWVVDFCKEKIRRGSTVPFYPNVHATVCTEEMFQLMAEANCYEIAVGIESGSPKILKQIGKGTTVDTIRRCVKWAKKAGILVRGYFILGMPEETEDDLRLTEAFAEELQLDEYGFSILCPYPGTEMYDREKYKDVDWARADEYSNNFWNPNHATNARLKEWQQYLTLKFRERLTWHNRVLEHDMA